MSTLNANFKQADAVTTLSVQVLGSGDSAGANAVTRAPLVLLHGWGANSQSWEALLMQLQSMNRESEEYRELWLIDLPGFGINDKANWSHFENNVAQTSNKNDPEKHRDRLSAALVQLEMLLPDKCVLMGWSLGGMLAVQLAHRHPSRVESLITIATNACFSMRDDWPEACPPNVYEKFYQGFAENPTAIFSRFLMLQAQGDRYRKRVVKALQAMQEGPQPTQQSAWLKGLEILDLVDNRSLLPHIRQPWLQIFGGQDALVPAITAEHLRASVAPQNAGSIHCLEAAGHAPHLSHTQAVAELINSHLGASLRAPLSAPSGEVSDRSVVNHRQDEYLRDKQAIAESFSKAANTYDGLAQLQVNVAEKLLAKRDSYTGNILDLGCGTGFCSRAIATEENNVIGLDIAPGMLQVASECSHLPLWLGADVEFLPISDQAIHGVVSSLSVQWCDDLSRVFAETYRVLKPGGWALFSTLAPGTLAELNTAWQSVDAYVHVNQFTPLEQVVAAATQQGFSIEQQQQQQEVLWFDSLMDLMRSLKGIGAHNVNAGQNKGLTSRRKIVSLQEAYETCRCDRGLPATYEVIYLVLQKPLEEVVHA